MDHLNPDITIDVLCLGSASMTLAPDGHGRYTPEVTGDMAEAAFAVAQAGAQAALASRIGRDALGTMLLSKLGEQGIGTFLLEQDAQAPTALSVGEGGDVVHHHTGSALEHLSPAYVSTLPLVQCHVLHVSVRSALASGQARAAIEAACSLARRLGCRVSVDLSLQGVPSLAEPLAHDLLRLADIAFVTPADCGRLVGTQQSDACADRIRSLGPALSFVNMAEDGALLATEEGVLRVDPVTDEPIDARGTHAAFIGYALSSLTAGDDLMTTMTLAHSAAAIAGGMVGRTETIPALDVLLDRAQSDTAISPSDARVQPIIAGPNPAPSSTYTRTS